MWTNLSKLGFLQLNKGLYHLSRLLPIILRLIKMGLLINLSSNFQLTFQQEVKLRSQCHPMSRSPQNRSAFLLVPKSIKELRAQSTHQVKL